MTVATEVSERLRNEAEEAQHVARLLLEKLRMIESERAAGKLGNHDPAQEVAAEHGYTLSYVMHVLWGMESDADVVQLGGEFRLPGAE
ncbi:MAG TPA: hypothetical protein VFH76_26400 [Kribbella sp.]|jgi:hypothetical protein|nr:hypothetical protein [Kribbella sp.]